MTKPKPTSVPSRAGFEKQIAAFEHRDKELLAEQLELEGAGIKLEPDAAPRIRLVADAEALVRREPIGAPVRTLGNRLHEVMRHRDIFKAATELAQMRLQLLKVEQSREIAHDLEQAWAAKVRAIAALLLHLKESLADLERLRGEWVARVGLDVRPVCCGHAIDLALAISGVDGPGYRFIAGAKRAGIIEKV